jgi:hypothetical protein
MVFDANKLGRFYCTSAVNLADVTPANVAAVKVGSVVNFVGGFKRLNNATATSTIFASTAMNTTISYTIIDVASSAVQIGTAMAAMAVTLLNM